MFGGFLRCPFFADVHSTDKWADTVCQRIYMWDIPSYTWVVYRQMDHSQSEMHSPSMLISSATFTNTQQKGPVM